MWSAQRSSSLRAQLRNSAYIEKQLGRMACCALASDGARAPLRKWEVTQPPAQASETIVTSRSMECLAMKPTMKIDVKLDLTAVVLLLVLLVLNW